MIIFKTASTEMMILTDCLLNN